MSFFNNLFGNSSGNGGHAPFWTEIKTDKDIEQAIDASHISKTVIFKHSTRCIISKTVLRNFEKEAEQHLNEGFSFFFLDLLAHRNLSDRLAREFNVTHQSPQIIVLKDGEVINHASHDAISMNLV